MSNSSSSWSVSDSPLLLTSHEAEADHLTQQPPPNSPPPSSLAWYYIIATLADSKAELSLLKELVNRVPNFYTDAPQYVQERLALRYLEECASKSRCIVDTKDNTVAATATFSDDDTSEDENGDAALLSSELDLKDSKRIVDKNGKRKEKHVKSNDKNVSRDSRDMLGGGGEEVKKGEADLAFAWLNKYIHVKSGPGATSGNYEAMPMNEETGNERRREDRINADAKNTKMHTPTPCYSNKVAGPHRRNMLPWSAEEENARRKGMKKFGVTVTADGRIPWSAILQLYQNVFHKTRFPNDFKDKWRNIMKKEERVDS